MATRQYLNAINACALACARYAAEDGSEGTCFVAGGAALFAAQHERGDQARVPHGADVDVFVVTKRWHEHAAAGALALDRICELLMEEIAETLSEVHLDVSDVPVPTALYMNDPSAEKLFPMLTPEGKRTLQALCGRISASTPTVPRWRRFVCASCRYAVSQSGEDSDGDPHPPFTSVNLVTVSPDSPGCTERFHALAADEKALEIVSDFDITICQAAYVTKLLDAAETRETRLIHTRGFADDLARGQFHATPSFAQTEPRRSEDTACDADLRRDLDNNLWMVCRQLVDPPIDAVRYDAVGAPLGLCGRLAREVQRFPGMVINLSRLGLSTRQRLVFRSILRVMKYEARGFALATRAVDRWRSLCNTLLYRERCLRMAAPEAYRKRLLSDMEAIHCLIARPDPKHPKTGLA